MTTTTRASRVPIVSISPIEDDHIALRRILNRSESSAWTRAEWILHPKLTLASALPALRENQVPVVFVERDLGTDSWRDVLSEVAALPSPPLLIVSSRTADEYLWAEALNLGAYDVVAKPFDAQEVCRVAESARNRWSHRHGIRWPLAEPLEAVCGVSS